MFYGSYYANKICKVFVKLLQLCFEGWGLTPPLPPFPVIIYGPHPFFKKIYILEISHYFLRISTKKKFDN